MPGRSYRGALDFTVAESELAQRLRAHVAALASSERNVDLERPAHYIEQQLGAARTQEFQSGGRRVRNIESGAGAVVGGAHYDTGPGSPGAEDNASRVAGLFFIARMGLPARFVGFADVGKAIFQNAEMGSHCWGARAHR